MDGSATHLGLHIPLSILSTGPRCIPDQNTSISNNQRLQEVEPRKIKKLRHFFQLGSPAHYTISLENREGFCFYLLIVSRVRVNNGFNPLYTCDDVIALKNAKKERNRSNKQTPSTQAASTLYASIRLQIYLIQKPITNRTILTQVSKLTLHPN